MVYQCEATERPAQPVLSIRTATRVQELPNLLQLSYGRLFGYLNELGESPGGMPFAAYHNFDMQNLDVEIGVPTTHALPRRGEIASGEIPGGSYGITLHTGPYEKLNEAYEALGAWIAQQGYAPGGVVYEFYLTGPEVPPEQTQTQIMMPLK